MKPYIFLTTNILSYGGYSIVSYREEDVYKIMHWRNEQMDVLRQKKTLSDADQLEYYHSKVMASFSEPMPTIILFSYLDADNECIGYGGLTNINWEDKRAEISFLVETSRTKNVDQYQNDFGCFLTLMKQVAFKEMNFNKLFTETYDIRPLHISVLEKNGFRLEGRLREHVYINGKFEDSLLHGYLKSYYESEK